MTHEAVIFDLDGTLADTLTDIAAAGNHMLESFGLPRIETARFRHLAGQGVLSLVSEALGPEHRDELDEGVRRFRAFYVRHGLDHTAPYEGVPELLDVLSRRGVKLAVLSNKPHDAVVEVLREIFGRWRFDAAVGHRPNTALKPDPSAALGIAQALGADPTRCVYVGDTRVDMRTGKSAGFFTVGVTWGFRDEPELREAGADAIIHTPPELLGLLR